MAGHFVLEERPQAGAGARAPDDGQALSGAGAALQILITADHESAARGPAEAGSESPLAPGTRMSWRGRGPSHPQLTDSSPRKAQGPGSKRPGGQSSNSKRRTSVGLGSGQAILVTQLCSWGPRSEGVACGCHRWVLGGGRGVDSRGRMRQGRMPLERDLESSHIPAEVGRHWNSGHSSGRWAEGWGRPRNSHVFSRP